MDMFRTLEAKGKIAGERLPAPFPLWLIEVPEHLDTHLLACLSDEECDRAARFRTPALARRYCTAHVALRVLGEAFLGISAGQQCYEIGPSGKPRLKGITQSHCNVSYGRERVLVGWSRDHEIGVDLEFIRPIPEAGELAEFHFTHAENIRLAQAQDRDRAFLTVWVRKEACVKALGSGLNMALSSFECDVDPGSVLVEIEGSSIESHVYDLKDDHVVAWARYIPPNRSDRIQRHLRVGPLAAGVSTAEVAAVPRG